MDEEVNAMMSIETVDDALVRADVVLHTPGPGHRR
jgi:hypothetical protein